MQITKSDFLIFLDEPMHFWASLHVDETSRHFSEFQQHLARQGQITEKYAKSYLEQVILPQYGGNAELRWQPEFRDGVFYTKLDALIHDKATDTYDLYEIKATGSPDKYFHDIAFQKTVCEATISINRSFIVHLNKGYSRSGELDLSTLFTATQVDNDIQRIHAKIMSSRAAAVRVATLPDTSTLHACTKPKDCPCQHLCHATLPRYPIYDLPKINPKSIETLRALGVFAIEDIPDDFTLSKSQRAVAEVVRAGKPFIDQTAIGKMLKKIVYPIAFFDYEAVITSIPEYDGYAPNQSIAFQYSLHVIADEDAPILHYEFLADGGYDPAYDLVQHLAQYMPDSGSIIVWNKSYEAGINRDLGQRYAEYSGFAENMNQRLYDLGDIFSKRLYCHPDFHGSWSIKYVLPVLVPVMTYSDMPVAHGGHAVQAWNRLIDNSTPALQKSQLRENMLAYCKQDTLAMVEIWKALRNLCD